MPGNVINLQIKDGISPALEQVGRAAKSRALRMVMGRAVVAALEPHLPQLDGERHKNEVGIRYYAAASRSVQQPQVSGDDIRVSVNQEGFAQRYYGGTITAGSNGSGKKWLTIPAIPAVLGRRAGDFSHLKFVFFKGKDLAALVSEDPAKVRFSRGKQAKKERGVALVPREDGRLPVVFWLKRSVTQKADPSVIPEEQVLTDTANAAGLEYLREAYILDGGQAS